jgi:hypothetical protein
MAEQLDKPTTASELAGQRFDTAIELAIKGRSPYPNGAAFVGTDVPDLGPTLAGYAREHRPVVLVYPDGEERFILPLEAAPSLWDSIARAIRAGFTRLSGRARG